MGYLASNTQLNEKITLDGIPKSLSYCGALEEDLLDKHPLGKSCLKLR
ncbi:MAG: hypothetical protein RLZZ66_1039 [Pseudomonadota bacterium]